MYKNATKQQAPNNANSMRFFASKLIEKCVTRSAEHRRRQYSSGTLDCSGLNK